MGGLTAMTGDLTRLFSRFRSGDLTCTGLREGLRERAEGLEGPAADSNRLLLEQAVSRIDMIVWGVCEAERDAHIVDLLRELETKLPPSEP